jgi:hypothetical protein
MKKLLLISVAALFLATGTAQACDCCWVHDPTGTPLNVRDKPNGKILFTLRNKEVVNGPDIKLKYEDPNQKWAFVFSKYGEGWVFRKYISCEADKL